MERVSLNNQWKYSKEFVKEMLSVSFDEQAMEEVRIPHTNQVLPYNYFDEKDYQFVSAYRKTLDIKSEWKEKRIFITFEGIGHIAEVYINGTLAATHSGGYTSFQVEVSKFLKFGTEQGEVTENTLAVVVDSRESSNIPPFGNVIDYLTYGGIYREVYLDIKEQTFLEDVYVVSKEPEEQNQKENGFSYEVSLQMEVNGDLENETLQVKYVLNSLEKETVEPVILTSGIKNVDAKKSELTFMVKNVKRWDVDSPQLYLLKVELWSQKDGSEKLLDCIEEKIGFRTCEFRKDGFYMNHKKVKILGLNRHQSFPYVGYAMPKRMQERDAEILKEELLVNAVRTSHYPQSKHFINRCDELGLLVFTEIPGWQHIGDDEWKKTACENVREMVKGYRNHPSIILWGVRINESMDDDEFYLKTNQIAHELDPSRQTSGVRFLKKSHLLEDVYAYNDFLHNGKTAGLDKKEKVTSNKHAPYLVSEFNGHMFPTKSFDSEEHRLEHALRHARVVDDLFIQEEISGGFGWCMFDYNTHKDFGSGDRICYHGVLDMFRNHKLAAAVFASQSEQKLVAEVSTTYDIGEHPACNIGDIYLFTNADSVKVYKNNAYIKEFFPKRNRFKKMPHPPILIDDLVGELLEKNEQFSHHTSEGLKKVLFAIQKYGQNALPLKYMVKMGFIMLYTGLDVAAGTQLFYKYIANWGGNASNLRLEFIKDGVVQKEVVKAATGKVSIRAQVPVTTLIEADTYDVVDVRLTANDEFGNRVPFFQEPLRLETEGAIELIGPNIVSMQGGATGTYIKTVGKTGSGTLKIWLREQMVQEISFQVIEKAD